MKTSGTCIGSLIVLTASLFAVVYAQEPPAVRCIARAAVDQVTFGDSLTVVCTIDTPTGLLTAEPFIETPSSSYDIQSAWHRHQSIGDSGSREQYGFLVHVFALDSLFIGPFIVQVTDETGREFLFESNTLVLPVESVLADEDTGLLPNRNPMIIPSRGVPAWMFAALVGFLTALILLIITRNRHHQPEVLPVPEKPVDEIGVFQKIDALKLAEQGHYKELYILLSTALRGFIHRNMSFEAMYDTTDEIIREMKKTSYDADIISAMTGILQESDQVKFARYIPSRQQASKAVERALAPVRSILDENRRRSEVSAAAPVRQDMAEPKPSVAGEQSPTPPGEKGR